MSEAEAVDVVEAVETDQTDQSSDLAALQEQMAAITAENDRLMAKINAANKHQKDSERAARQAEREKAEAAGNYEQLFKSSENERQTLAQQLEEMRAANEAKEISGQAMKLAIELADGPNAEILADYISRRLKYTDNGIKITDSNGDLTVSTLADLKGEFAGSARFASLIKGNQSSGGGAIGGTNGGGAAQKTISRAEFDALDPIAKAKHFKAGGEIQDI